jgi:hypothetical protein
LNRSERLVGASNSSERLVGASRLTRNLSSRHGGTEAPKRLSLALVNRSKRLVGRLFSASNRSERLVGASNSSKRCLRLTRSLSCSCSRHRGAEAPLALVNRSERLVGDS